MATIPSHSMNLVASKLRHIPPNPNASLNFRGFCVPPISLLNKTKSNSSKNAIGVRARGRVSELENELKEKWLDSLSCPFQAPTVTNLHIHGTQEGRAEAVRSEWVLGIDPDVYGAVALLKDHDGDTSASCSSEAQVFDTPHLQVLVGKRVRKRLDARSIVQLLHSFGAPLGTTAYIEQSNPFPQDGKQGWWSGGFTYGLWIGILVSSGFSVVPVFPRHWKDQYQLSSKDDSRKAASDLFPSLSSSFKRKKDHGRAEALLIAAYGKGVRFEFNSSSTCIETSVPTLSLECSSITEL